MKILCHKIKKVTNISKTFGDVWLEILHLCLVSGVILSHSVWNFVILYLEVETIILFVSLWLAICNLSILSVVKSKTS